MQRSIFLATTLLPLLALSSAFADSTVYAWRDKNGTMTFTDNRALAPKDTKVEVRSYITESAPTATGRAVAQRAFAQRLASELGLGDNLNAEEAADALVKIGIAPRLGRWNLDEPMTRALMNRLRTLTVGAAVSGKIPLQPEQALIAFDSTAALTGIRIRETEPVPTPPAPQPARQAAVPIYIVPTVPAVVSEPVILGGGAIADPFLTGALPTIIVDQRVVNINKNVVNLRPRMRRPQQRVRRVRARPPPTQRPPKRGHRPKPYANRRYAPVVMSQPGRRVATPRRTVSTRRVTTVRRAGTGRRMVRTRVGSSAVRGVGRSVRMR